MKFTPKFALFGALILWILLVLPFFIPALNRTDPKILGLPFTVFFQYAVIALHGLLIIFCRYKVWDSFDGAPTEEGDVK